MFFKKKRNHNGTTSLEFITYRNHADFYSKQGRWVEAIDAFKKAIVINPEHARTHFGLGMAYVMVDNVAGALKEYEALKLLDERLAEQLHRSIYHTGPSRA
jgi:tetratricopeptide (TPR) repeat protein